MAHLAEEVISGPLRDWLAAERQALNGRFRLMRQRFPKLDGEVVLTLCREFLPAVAAEDPGEAGELLHAMYDLLLLHAARGTLTPQRAGGGSLPGIRTLFTDTFPRLRRLLLARPRYLPGALSNAVENMADRGVEFASRLGEVGTALEQPDTLLDAGAVLAWRLGDARLRSAALRIAAGLEPTLFLRLLGLASCPASAAPQVAEALTNDGWRLPQQMASPTTPDATPGQRRAKKPSWFIAGRLGNFRGFGGTFNEPPVLLGPGPDRDRHRFWVQCGKAVYRIDGDVFGWVCRPDAVDLPRCSAKTKTSADLPAATTSVLALDGLVAFTRSDSFRVRILLAALEPM
jgi:hypothetical protein